MSMLMQLIVVLSWLAIPVALVCMVDDWFLRPARQARAAPQPVADAPLMAACYYALPVLVAAGVIRLFTADRLDFSLVLVIICVVTGIIWLIDALVFRPRRDALAPQGKPEAAVVTEPGTVDYARSFFPVALIVLLLRAFIFEPFRIPSDSMMPTLLDGDFIIVNKYDYGLRLPVANRKIVAIGEPQRGDVVVFRYPPDPSVNFIKRLVGLPGDRVAVHDDRLIINGQAVATTDRGFYEDGCYEGLHLAVERLGRHTHEIMFCPSPDPLLGEYVPTCGRKGSHGYVCPTQSQPGLPDKGDYPETVIPPGKYLMMGDNRDNSDDGRDWGFVPEANLIGKATLIWFNWDLQRSGGPMWSRIGSRIQ